MKDKSKQQQKLDWITSTVNSVSVSIKTKVILTSKTVQDCKNCRGMNRQAFVMFTSFLFPHSPVLNSTQASVYVQAFKTYYADYHTSMLRNKLHTAPQHMNRTVDDLTLVYPERSGVASSPEAASRWKLRTQRRKIFRQGETMINPQTIWVRIGV